MKLGIRRALLMGLAVLGVFIMQAVPADATVPVNAGVGLVDGGGTISPGLTVIPAPQTFTFTSVSITTVGLVHKSPTVLGTSACAANGQSGVFDVTGTLPPNLNLSKRELIDVGDSLAQGTGLGTWTCFGGPLAGKGGLLYYQRVGPIVIVVLTDGGKPIPSGLGALACLFLANEDPTVEPVTSYTLTCGGGVAQVDLTLP